MCVCVSVFVRASVAAWDRVYKGSRSPLEIKGLTSNRWIAAELVECWRRVELSGEAKVMDKLTASRQGKGEREGGRLRTDRQTDRQREVVLDHSVT